MGSDQSVNLISSMEEVTGTDIISRGDNVVIHLYQRVFCWVLNKSHFCLLESCAQVMTVFPRLILKLITGSVFVNSLFYCECTAKLLHLYTRGCGEGGVFCV